MKSRIRVVITLILVLAIKSSWGQAPASFSLKEAQDYGVTNHVQVKQAQIDVQKAEATVDERLSSGFPQLNASIDYQNFFKLPTSLIPAEFFEGGVPGEFIPVQFGTEQNVTAGISASQLLFNGAWFIGVNAAKTYVGMVEAQQTLATQDVKKNVEQAYYSVLIAEEFEKLLEKNITNLSTVLHEVSEMNKQGFVEEIDVDRLKISKSTLDGQLENAKRQTALAEAYLKFTMGIEVNAPITLTDTLGGLSAEMNAATGDQNYLARPEFTIMQTLVDLNEYNVRVNKSMYLPTLALYGSYSENAQRNEFNFFNGDEEWYETGIVGVRMDIPIFSGFQRKATLTNAQLDLEKAQLNQQNTTQGILLEIESARTTYLNAQTDLQTQNENIALAQKIYNTTLIKYKAGVGSSIELTSAESTLYQTQGSYIGALYNLLTAKTNLTKSLGYY